MNNVIELNKLKRQSKDEINFYKATNFNSKTIIGRSLDYVYTYELGKNNDYTIIKLSNNSQLYYIKPQVVKIDTLADNDIIIVNTSDKNETYKFNNLHNGDNLILNSDYDFFEYVKCNNENWDANNNFNQKWLKLINGENLLKIYGKCNIQIQFNYPIYK